MYDLNQSFLQMMPDDHDSGDTIRYHMENQMLPEMIDSGRGGNQHRYSEFEKNYLQSMADKYPFLISWLYERYQDMEQFKLEVVKPCSVMVCKLSNEWKYGNIHQLRLISLLEDQIKSG